ncbi:hypothetical protein LA080_004193 [Diaporthe eres]|nr:hypothetical protein LA080_004193 [Diaporthe eres]
MSGLPQQKFYKHDIVIHCSADEEDNDGGYMGVVVGAEWQPFLRSYSYEYNFAYNALDRTPSGSRLLSVPSLQMSRMSTKSAGSQILRGREGNLRGHVPALRREIRDDLTLKRLRGRGENSGWKEVAGVFSYQCLWRWTTNELNGLQTIWTELDFPRVGYPEEHELQEDFKARSP